MSAPPPKPTLKIWLLPVFLLAGIPIAGGSWWYFYAQQHAELELASSPAATEEELAKLGRQGNLDVRLRVALNPKTPKKVLRKLAEEPTLRYYVVFEADTPPVFLRAIAEDPKSKHDALLSVAGHKNVTADVLDAMAGHPRAGIRLAVSGNTATPVKILCRMRSDDDPKVAERAQVNLDLKQAPCEADPL